MQGAGHADVLVILQVPGNKADAVPCERLPFLLYLRRYRLHKPLVNYLNAFKLFFGEVLSAYFIKFQFYLALCHPHEHVTDYRFLHFEMVSK